MRPVITLLFVLAQLVSCNVIAQWRSVKITEKHKLPKSGIFQVKQDSKGVMWFSHRTGVTRFNGQKLQKFEFTNGLPALSVYQTFEDSQNRVWFYTDAGSLCYYKEGEIFTEKEFPVFKEANFSSFISTISEDEFGNVWFGSLKNGIVKLTTDNKIERLHASNKNNLPESIFGLIPTGLNQLTCLSSQDISIINTKSNRIIWQERISENPYYTLRNAKVSSSEILFFSAKKTWLFDFVKRKAELIGTSTSKDEVIFVSENTSKGILVGKRNGLFQFDLNTHSLKPFEEPFSNQAVSSVIEVSPDEFWVTTLESGIYKWKNFPVNQSFKSESPVFTFTKDADKLYVGFNNGKVGQFDGTRMNFSIFSSTYSNAQKILFLKENYIVYFSTNYISVKEIKNNKVYTVPLATKSMLYDSAEDNLYLGYNYGFFKMSTADFVDFAKNYSMVRMKELMLSVNFEKNTKVLYKIDKSILLAGTTSGLFVFDTKENKITKQVETVPPIPIMSINSYDETWVILTTFGSGILFYNKKTDEVIKITTEDGFASNFCTSSYIDNDSTLWIVTQNGLSSIDVKSLKNQDFVIQNYNNSDGLPNATVHAITSFRGKYYVGCENGIYSFAKKTLLSNRAKKLRAPISTIGSSVDNSKPNVTGSSISINLQAVDYEYQTNPTYFYKLSGVDNDWKKTQNETVQYEGLNAGNYDFEVRVQSGSGLFSPVSHNKFKVVTSITESWWFYPLLFILLSAIAIWLFWSGAIKVDLERIHEAFATLIGKVTSDSKNDPILIIKTTDGEYKKMPISDLFYIAASGNYIEYHTKTGKYVSRNTMKTAETELDGNSDIIRIHRSYIINTNYLNSFDSKTLTIQNETIPIGKNYHYLLDTYKSKLKID